MTEHRIAARYAEALFALAQQTQAAAPLGAELEELASLVQRTPQLRALLERPDLPPAWKLQALREALGQAFSETIMRLLSVLLYHQRGDALAQVAQTYRELADEAAGVLPAEARTAVPLTPEQRARLTAALQRLTGRQVRLEARTDPSVLAGVRLQIGDRLLDGSAAGRLAHMRQELLEQLGSNP